ncbi:sensor histidine kinase [Labilithrix luteola]|uniref:histidine kinase n=2 Tax=Labilithrix luteola TaxID=1391654 RepID=A0A0K1Q1K7_9BACT|nr:sensor histidine kinase [Labilithrix luteola]
MTGTPSDDARNRFAAIGEIAAEIAHELRNALQIISANAYLAQLDPARSAPQLAKIERNARVAHEIVDDLMALARGEAARAEPTPLADVLLGSREHLPEPGATFEDALTPSDLRVSAHPGLLTRLLHVLYENAIGASTPEGRRPTIQTRAKVRPEGAVLEVEDDGPGVPDEIADRLFEPLVSARPGGTGLGLALAVRIAGAHGGTLVHVPRPVGTTRGATFRITLPTRNEHS